jgi:hypothetical protein
MVVLSCPAVPCQLLAASLGVLGFCHTFPGLLDGADMKREAATRKATTTPLQTLRSNNTSSTFSDKQAFANDQAVPQQNTSKWPSLQW